MCIDNYECSSFINGGYCIPADEEIQIKPFKFDPEWSDEKFDKEFKNSHIVLYGCAAQRFRALRSNDEWLPECDSINERLFKSIQNRCKKTEYTRSKFIRRTCQF